MALDANMIANYEMVGLPMQAASPVDVGRLLRELERIDDALNQVALRKDDKEVKMPHTSLLMDQMIQLNKLNLLETGDRQRLAAFLALVKEKAPVLHMSFSADPSPAFVAKLMAWLRGEIHPLTLMTIGLQPNLGAGCIVRSTNKYFDLSLRQDFLKKRDMLKQAISALVTKETAA
jgi:hypothetical protein